jgi:hypothetical protein
VQECRIRMEISLLLLSDPDYTVCWQSGDALVWITSSLLRRVSAVEHC